MKLAHLSDDGRFHALYDHLISTSIRAAEMAALFNSAEWCRIAALWHDLGKHSQDFQKMIRSSLEPNKKTKHGKVNHSTAGAIYAIREFSYIGRIMAYLISGHHAGLPDWQSENSGQASLSQRLKETKLLEDALESNPSTEVLKQIIPKEKPKQGTDPALWIRMLFSCLVDSDFLDTEEFFDSNNTEARKGYPDISELLPAFQSYMADKQKKSDNTPVNIIRAGILARCIEMAEHNPAIFTLTVPTGGGKTLSSMAFAINHAIRYKKRRVIYVIPYTSIIEQTANVLRNIFGDIVIEHHSNFDADDESEWTQKNALASENWDAPIIVTTSVQFFESLFASRPSRCRKIHNIVDSVVILDEAQLLPAEFLSPILAVLQELYKNYGVTLVLSTATQPALCTQSTFDFNLTGFKETKEIIEDPSSLHQSLKRVEVEILEDLLKPKTWEELSSELKLYPSVLCIVNRRDDCRKLHQLMPEGTYHLSALMCGAHRSDTISVIKKRLRYGEPTRVISTQLVEAGVDLDFPVVYRAVAGLDSIAQAAGRCNREGKMDKGRVVVFMPESKIPAGHLRQAGEIGRRLLAEKAPDPLSPERFTHFFKELYWLKGKEGLDKHGILHYLSKNSELHFSFRTAADKFHIIDESKQGSVIVNYLEGAALIEKLKRNGPDRWLMRKLQRYTVNVPKYLHENLLKNEGIIELYPGIYVQAHNGLYHNDLGFLGDRSIVYEPDDLLV
ncbi:MAG: CRISPR-associated helicase Cas3' [Deltaproteobacteria bacterium]|nr:CRISPR-associated helicase Cas3' [Deltaproteobacteria bacterium]